MGTPCRWPASLLCLLVLLLCLGGEGAAGVVSANGTRVALYLVGPPRTLNATLCSLLDNVVRPLLAERCRLTVFIYTPRSPDTEQYDAVAAIPDVEVVMHSVTNPPRPPAPCMADLNARIRLVHGAYNAELLDRFRSREGVDLLRVVHEAVTGVRYDWVLLARPDVTFVDRLPPISTLSPQHVHVPIWHNSGGVNDRFAVVPRNLTTRFFRLFRALCTEGLARQIPKQVVNPETLYRWYLEDAKVPIALLRNFFFVRTRMEHTSFGQLHGRDLALLDATRCVRAFKYRRCWLTQTAQRGLVARVNASTPHALQVAKALCNKFQRSAIREASAAERYAVALSQKQQVQLNTSAALQAGTHKTSRSAPPAQGAARS
eukprot:EG_transcript_13345